MMKFFVGRDEGDMFMLGNSRRGGGGGAGGGGGERGGGRQIGDGARVCRILRREYFFFSSSSSFSRLSHLSQVVVFGRLMWWNRVGLIFLGGEGGGGKEKVGKKSNKLAVSTHADSGAVAVGGQGGAGDASGLAGV